MSNKVIGIVHKIGQTETFGVKGFRKRLVVLEQDNGAFTNYVPIDFIKDMCDEVDEMHIGDEVEIAYTLQGRRWQKNETEEPKYFLNAQASRFRVLSQVPQPSGDVSLEEDAPF